MRSLIAALLLISTTTAFAESSSARISITISIPKMTVIKQLADINFGDWSGESSLSREQQLCIWASTGYYSLSIASSNPTDGTLNMRSEDGESLLGYGVSWNDGRGYKQLEHGVLSENLQSSPVPNCESSEGIFSHMRLDIDRSSLMEANPGEYQDTLEFQIIAE